MTQICNKYLPVDDLEDLELKDASIKSASRELYLAASSLMLAGSKIEAAGSDSAHARPYLEACVRHLSATVDHYDIALQIVEGSTPSSEALEWISKFDFERFFSEKTASGSMPDRRDLWTEFIVRPSKRGDASASTKSLRDRVHELRSHLASCLDVGRFSRQSALCMREAVTMLTDAQMLAVMIAELNDVKPLDPSWAVPGPGAEDASIRPFDWR